MASLKFQVPLGSCRAVPHVGTGTLAQGCSWSPEHHAHQAIAKPPLCMAGTGSPHAEPKNSKGRQHGAPKATREMALEPRDHESRSRDASPLPLGKFEHTNSVNHTGCPEHPKSIQEPLCTLLLAEGTRPSPGPPAANSWEPGFLLRSLPRQ